MQQKEFECLVKKLPYTAPFLLISGLHSISRNLHISAWHEYRADDTLVKSHFMGRFIAGSLISEQVCQTALLLLVNQIEDKLLPTFFLGKVSSDYLLPVQPGKVTVIVEVTSQAPSYAIFHGTAWVENFKVAVVKGGVQIQN